MMHIFLSFLSLISFAIGVYVGWLGYKAYRKNKDKVLLTLCTGFFLIALSNLFEEFVLHILGLEVVHAHLIRIPLFTLGMIMILYSLKMK
ncbi:MAG: hypothetical protein OIN88_09180 [Candidatus Methanoperedens sp.]|nr:hypothetical protein [Candidatus Methanoperedens sp.]